MSTAIHRRVAACRAGADPTVIARLPSGWAVMGDPQVLRGYCLLLPDPVVPHLNALPPEGQAAFLADLARLGQAVLEVTGAVRINYAMFGNLEPALHAHVHPRFADEPESLRTAQPWAYDWSAARRFDVARDGALLAALRAQLAVPGA
jgi:diadenosine tetraphosphate (Ap4A) HIT family hydrolase